MNVTRFRPRAVALAVAGPAALGACSALRGGVASALAHAAAVPLVVGAVSASAATGAAVATVALLVAGLVALRVLFIGLYAEDVAARPAAVALFAGWQLVCLALGRMLLLAVA